MTDVIDKFFGDYRFLSNFYPSPMTVPVIYDGINHKEQEAVRVHYIDFPTVEHAYVACKSNSPEIQKFVATLDGAGAVKRYGRKIPLRPDWEQVKLNIMRMLVRKKFFTHDDLAFQLMQTHDAQLIEGNTWGDTYWGVCKGVGENNLGKILMAIRDELWKNAIKKRDAMILGR